MKTLRAASARMYRGLALIWVGCILVWISFFTGSDALWLAGLGVEFALGVPIWLSGVLKVRRLTR